MLNFDKDFANFKPETAYVHLAMANEDNLARLSIDLGSEDTVFGAEFVYCGAHGKPHSTGWCSVDIAQKRPLNALNIKDALSEVNSLGFPIIHF